MAMQTSERDALPKDSARREHLKRRSVGMQRCSTDIIYSADESGEPGVHMRLGCNFDRNVMDYNDVLFRNSSSSSSSSFGIIIGYTYLFVSYYKALEKFTTFLRASATLCHVSTVTF